MDQHEKCPSPKNCREVIEAVCQIESTQEDISQLKDDVRRIFDKMESNNRWLIGLFIGIGLESMAIIVLIIVTLSGGAHG